MYIVEDLKEQIKLLDDQETKHELITAAYRKAFWNIALPTESTTVEDKESLYLGFERIDQNTRFRVSETREGEVQIAIITPRRQTVDERARMLEDWGRLLEPMNVTVDYKKPSRELVITFHDKQKNSTQNYLHNLEHLDVVGDRINVVNRMKQHEEGYFERSFRALSDLAIPYRHIDDDKVRIGEDSNTHALTRTQRTVADYVMDLKDKKWRKALRDELVSVDLDKKGNRRT